MPRNAKNGMPRRLPVAMKFYEMMAKNGKKSVKEIFETHMKTLKKPNHEDTNSNSDLEHEYYCMEDVGLDLKDINASETVALSDLRRPLQKCQKINHLTPMTVVLIKTWLEKSRFKKNRILLDSRNSGYIILEKFIHKIRMQKDTTTNWIMKGGNFQTSTKCKTTSILRRIL